MRISKDQLRRIIKEELGKVIQEMDAASAHTIATGGETIERPKMPAGDNHYAGKGRYEDSDGFGWQGSGERRREEDLESIRLAGDLGEKPEPQQRWDISDETGVPVLRDELDDALARIAALEGK
jgi:hypothetical protein|tara:strand:+ start:244 stop:615 length:372 start_codon:yes stop_codon:yes gene_type:complete